MKNIRAHSEKICNLLLGLALVSVPLLGTELASLHQGEGCHKHQDEESCPLHYFDFFFHKRADALCSFLKSFDQSEPWAQVVGPFVRFLYHSLSTDVACVSRWGNAIYRMCLTSPPLVQYQNEKGQRANH